MNFLMSLNMLISPENLQDAKDAALKEVNQSYQDKEYKVVVREGAKVELRMFLLLDLYFPKEDRYEPIGCTHFVHLVEDFENLSDEKVARTVGELAESIQKAVKLHFEAKDNKNMLIYPTGTILDKNGQNVTVDNEGVLRINDVTVKFKGEPVKLTRNKGLFAEGTTKLIKLENGDFELINPIDQRKGKGMFINKDTGDLYRG